MRVHPRIEQVSTRFGEIRIELYILRGQRNILIDTGTREMPEKDILPALAAVGLTLSDISLIINTHGHSDHTGGNAAVKDASGAPVFIHGDDALYLENPQRCFDLYYAPAMRALGEDLYAEKHAFLREFGKPMTPERYLREGDAIDGGAGTTLRVIHLPGHTLGSVGFYWEEENILFTGDSLAGLHFPNGKLPIILDLPAYMESVQKAQRMHIRFLLCSHHYRGIRLAPAPVRQGNDVDRYLCECLDFAQRLDEAVKKVILREPLKGFAQVADEIIAEFPEEMGFKPLTQWARPLCLSARTIYSHLHRVSQYGAM